MNRSASLATHFHADLDAFFASVEQHDDPRLAGKPVIVGARPGQRGVVSACSYEARACGVRSAMPISQAVRLCPRGVFLPVRMSRYIEASTAVMRVLEESAPSFCQISIDEAFMDFTGTERLLGSPEEIALTLKKRIRSEFGLVISIGIAPNRFLAKMASQFRKPDGLYRIKPGGEESFLDLLRPGDIWGVGRKTAERLDELNLTSVAQIRALAEATLTSLFGKAGGAFLFSAVRGIDPGIFSAETKSRSLSSETTFETDRRDVAGINKVLLRLSHEVLFRLMAEGCKSRTAVLKIRYDNFETCSARTTLKHWICSAEELYAVARSLLQKKWNGKTPLRLLVLSLANVEETNIMVQPDLFAEEGEKRRKIEESILTLRRKFKDVKLTKARLMKPGDE